MTAPTTPALLATRTRWMDEGTERFRRGLEAIPDDALAQPSPLPHWTRAHIVAHIAGNARGLVNLLHWARTGVETPMYSSPDQRVAEIDAGALRPASELRADFDGTRRHLAEAFDAMPSDAWDVEVVTAQGRHVPAVFVPWMRTREVWIHAVDLGAASFDDFPDALVEALLDEVGAAFQARTDCPSVEVQVDDGRAWHLGGGGSEVVGGSPRAILGWFLGRAVDPPLRSTAVGGVPLLPSWL